MELCNIITTNDINNLEPCLFLKCNEQHINGKLTTNESLGTLLSYPYVGPDWYNTKIDRYHINTIMMPNDIESPGENTQYVYDMFNEDEHYLLYSSLCPIDKFDNNVKNNISETINKFNNTLINYGYKCIILIHLYPKNAGLQFGINLFNKLMF